MFKALTGADRITGQRNYAAPFEFRPWCVPVFSCNRIPASSDVSDGYLRRREVTQFPNSFRGRENRRLADELAAELPGILANAVRRLPGLLGVDVHVIPQGV